MTKRPLLVGLLGAALAITVLAALTRPFTVPADVVVSAALVALIAVVVLQHLVPGLPRPFARRIRPAPIGARHGWVLWGCLIAVLYGWESFCYLSSPRHDHPTLSSMIDAVTATSVGRGFAFFCWLALGYYLVTE